MDAAEARGGSAGAGEDARAGDDCLDNGCLDFSSPCLRGGGGGGLFLRGGSSFAGAGMGLGPESEFGPFTGLRLSFFSGGLFFLSFLPLPCF